MGRKRSRRARIWDLLRRCVGRSVTLRSRDPLRDYLVRMQLLSRKGGSYRTTERGYGVLLVLTP